MATIILGCDENNSNDHKVQNTVAKILEKAGHKVTKLAVDSNAFASASYSKKNKGKIGVYLMAASVFSVADFAFGSTQMKYAYFGIRGDASPSIKTENDFKTKKIRPDNDCTSICNKLAGKTYPEMNEKTKKRCQCVFGKTGEEIGNAIVKALGGDTDNSSKSSKTSTGSSIKEALKKAIKKWDGEAEIRLIGDTVYVNKIANPANTKLVINEYDNIIYDSVTLTDVNPSTINFLRLQYKDYELTLKDDILINRFGKISKTIQAPSTIKTLSDAKQYLNRQWNKIRREDGRQLECKVPGHTKWKTGKWVHVYLPSFFIDDYMYITKISSEEDGTGNWLINLALVDYPPSFGVDAS